MSRTFPLAVLALAALQSARADEDSLRRAVRLPSVEVKAAVGFHSVFGFIGHDSPRPAGSEEELKKSLRGTDADAEVYLKLARLSAAAGDQDEAAGQVLRAVELFQNQAEANPTDATVWLHFSEALSQADLPADAKDALDKAVKLGPDLPEVWWEMAAYHDRRVWEALIGTEQRRKAAGVQDWLAALLLRELGDDALKAARAEMQSAHDCHDRAVRAAPRDGRVYARRAGSRFMWAMVEGVICLAREKKRADVYGSLPYDEIIADLKKAAELDPRDARSTGVIALLTIASGKLSPELKSLEDVWPCLSPERKQVVRDCAARLEKLSRDDDTSLAADAAELRGFIEFFRADRPAMLKWYRRVIRLDPDRHTAWEMVLGILASDNDPDLVPTAERYVERHDTAHTRYLLAKSYDVFGQHEKAEEQVRIAWDKAPDDPTLNLAMAAVLLRRGEGKESLDRAKEYLAKTQGLTTPTTPDGFKAEAISTLAVYAALVGQPEQARKMCRYVLQHQPGSEAAREVLRALDE